MVKRYGLGKEERLCSLKLIRSLFAEGKSFYQFPVRVIYRILREEAKYPVQAAFSVSKKSIRTATGRNFIRRRMKEAYRMNKPVPSETFAGKGLIVMFIYSSQDILSTAEIAKVMKTATSKLGRIINQASDHSGDLKRRDALKPPFL